jgi:hypothetical protein
MDVLGPGPEDEARPWTTADSGGVLPATTDQKVESSSLFERTTFSQLECFYTDLK